MNKQDMITVNQVCKILKKSPQTIRNWNSRGILKASFIDENTGYRYYEKNVVLEFLKKLNVSNSEPLYTIKITGIEGLPNKNTYTNFSILHKILIVVQKSNEYFKVLNNLNHIKDKHILIEYLNIRNKYSHYMHICGQITSLDIDLINDLEENVSAHKQRTFVAENSIDSISYDLAEKYLLDYHYENIFKVNDEIYLEKKYVLTLKKLINLLIRDNNFLDLYQVYRVGKLYKNNLYDTSIFEKTFTDRQQYMNSIGDDEEYSQPEFIEILISLKIQLQNIK